MVQILLLTWCRYGLLSQHWGDECSNSVASFLMQTRYRCYMFSILTFNQEHRQNFVMLGGAIVLMKVLHLPKKRMHYSGCPSWFDSHNYWKELQKCYERCAAYPSWALHLGIRESTHEHLWCYLVSECGRYTATERLDDSFVWHAIWQNVWNCIVTTWRSSFDYRCLFRYLYNPYVIY